MNIIWYLILTVLGSVSGLELFQIQDSERNLREQGFQIHYPTENNSFIVSGTGDHPQKRRHRKFKFDGSGYQQLLLIAAVEPAHKIVHDIQSRLHVKPFIYNHHMIQSTDGVFMIRILNDRFLNDTISWFVSHPAVLWVDFHRRHYKHNVDALTLAMGPFNHTYTAKNQVITVGDTGLDVTHNYFHSPEGPTKVTFNTLNLNQILQTPYHQDAKVRLYVNVAYFDGLTTVSTDFEDEANGHGTHVSGSCCGNGAQNNQPEIESQAKIVFFDFGVQTQEYLIIPPMLTPLLQISYHAGSRLMTNSWGSATCEYTFTAMEIDRFMYFHRDYLVLISAGNSGPGESTVGSPGTFKNGITVGASQNTRASFLKSQRRYWDDGTVDLVDPADVMHSGYGEENLADFSSRGPTCDGRVKPDVVYPGQFVLSSRAKSKLGSGELLYMQGTSMATPGLARLAAVVREVLQDRHQIPEPTSALIKNIIITSTKRLGGSAQRLTLNHLGKLTSRTIKTYLDRLDQGWGRATAEPLLGDQLDFMEKVPIDSQGSWTKYYTAEKTYRLTMGLVWTDFPGYMYSTVSLVNDLNLIVRIINSTGHVRVVYGNQGTGPDSLNTVEQIRDYQVVVGEQLAVTVQAAGPLVMSGRTREEFSMVWYRGLQEIPPDRLLINISTLDLYLPLVQCQNPLEVLHPQLQTCFPTCTLDNLPGIQLNPPNCTCIHHQPCDLLLQTGQSGISHCNLVTGHYEPCSRHVTTPRHGQHHRSLAEILSLTTQGPHMDRGVFLFIFFLENVMLLLALIVICR